MIYRASILCVTLLFTTLCNASESNAGGPSNFNLWLFVIVAGLGTAWFWNKFVRLRCPECKTASPELLDEEELDRWRGTKQVSEKLGNGKYRTRTVGTTYVKMKRTYECTACKNVWSLIKKEEK